MVTDLIVGRYEILEELGEKKKAIDRLTGREVVVRSKHLEAAPQAELLERLVRLRHPNLAGFLHHFPLDGELWMVTEFVDGRTLESLLAEAVPVDSAKARAWMQGLAEGTMAAHEAGFLVGQLSPSKAVIGAGSGIKLLDAGLDGMAASGSGVQNEVSTLTAIYRRMLGEAGATNTALGKMEAAQNCSDFLTALKEVEAPAPTVGITPDRKLLPPTSKKPLFFRKWDRRHVIAIIATVIGIMVGYKMATHGQSGSGYVGRWIERMR